MKIVEINTCHFGSTGKIMLNIATSARSRGHIVKTYSRAWRGQALPCEEHEFFGSFVDNAVHKILGPITGMEGCFSSVGTRALLSELDKISPDIIHLHNLHGWYIDLSMLFGYIKKNKIKVVWTLHDCWAFTGHCPHFVIAKCDKWKTGCHHCPQPKIYPKMYIDASKKMYELKKKWFCGVDDMTIVTPSRWLADLVKQSFLKEYPVKVINNGIDLSIFKPTKSDFREKYGLEGKKIVLGVSFGWGYRKGLDVFAELAKRLDDGYKIVLVGTDDATEASLPENIISIHRTNNQQELAQIYTAADVFVMPTREENYPTVNMEAISCGTPVVTFRTGGSPEIVDENCGIVVEVDDICTMEKEVIRICENELYDEAACLERAKSFDMNDRFKEYIELYEKEKQK